MPDQTELSEEEIEAGAKALGRLTGRWAWVRAPQTTKRFWRREAMLVLEAAAKVRKEKVNAD